MKKIVSVFALIILGCSLIAQTPPEPASKIMDDAYKLAAKEGKQVMIIFHASWCGWCKKLDASMADSTCKEFFEKNFIVRHLDIMEQGDKKVLENKGAAELFKKYGGEGSGVPYFLIFDPKGALLADSKYVSANSVGDIKGINIGCPASDEEVAAFVQILKKTTKITDSQVTAVTERFIKNQSKKVIKVI